MDKNANKVMACKKRSKLKKSCPSLNRFKEDSPDKKVNAALLNVEKNNSCPKATLMHLTLEISQVINYIKSEGGV